MPAAMTAVKAIDSQGCGPSPKSGEAAISVSQGYGLCGHYSWRRTVRRWQRRARLPAGAFSFAQQMSSSLSPRVVARMHHSTHRSIDSTDFEQAAVEGFACASSAGANH